MHEAALPPRDEALQAAIRRWRLRALAAITISILCLTALVVLALRQRGTGAVPPSTESLAATRLQRAATAQQAVTQSREITAEIVVLRLSFADAESALLKFHVTGEKEWHVRLESALKRMHESADRLRERVETPIQQERMTAVVERLQRWTIPAAKLAKTDIAREDSRRAETLDLLRAGDDVRIMIQALADDANKRLEEREMALETLLQPK